MQVYEASIKYSLVRVGYDEPLNSPPKIVEYMTGAFDDAPLQESFYVICLNRKNRPLCRSRISLGTVSNTLVHPGSFPHCGPGHRERHRGHSQPSVRRPITEQR